MGDAGFFKGTSSEQDTRFKDKEKSLLRSINFPKELDQKVDMRKVELSVMKPWIADKIMDLLGFEDEVVVEYVNGLLEDPTSPVVDPKKMQINLTGFLESKTGPFMLELWALLISAQQSPLKIPALFIEQKKEEMRKKEQADLEAQALLKSQREQEEEKERRLAEIRRRERAQANTRDRDRPINGDHNSHRNPSRLDSGTGYSSRANFIPPRERDSGWGNRGETRLPEEPARQPTSTSRRDRSSSPRSRRDSHVYKTKSSSYRRPHSRSISRSRSRSLSRSRSPPPTRRSHRRASPSPRSYRRHTESSRSYRRESPQRRGRAERHRRQQRSGGGRSSSSDSPPRSTRRQRSMTRSVSPPRRRVSDQSTSSGAMESSRSNRRESNGKAQDHRRSAARSPDRHRSPPRKRNREEPAPRYQSRERHSGRSQATRAPSRSCSPRRKSRSQYDVNDDDKHREVHRKSAEKESSSNPTRSPQAISSGGRESFDSSREALKPDGDDGVKKSQPAVISIKGRASKTTEQFKLPVDQSTSDTSEDQTNHDKTDRNSAQNPKSDPTRSQKLTEVVKERLLREKVKASMNHR